MDVTWPCGSSTGSSSLRDKQSAREASVWAPRAHFGEDVAYYPPLVVLGDVRELRPGEAVVEIWNGISTGFAVVGSKVQYLSSVQTREAQSSK
jgi:hypothetical protein